VTTIGFVLTENARVDIELFTLTGESVLRITEQSPRAAGAYQTDTGRVRTEMAAWFNPEFTTAGSPQRMALVESRVSGESGVIR